MKHQALPIIATVALLLAGCQYSVATSTAAAPPSDAAAPSGTNAGVEQLRAQQRPLLRRAGVPEACIQQLSTSTLATVKSYNAGRTFNSMDWLTQRQQIRTAAAKDCGTI